MAWKWVDKLRGIEGRVHELGGTEYILTKNQISNGRYSVSRRSARMVLVYNQHPLPYTAGRVMFHSNWYQRPDDGLKIGCQYFDSSEADKIREWALKG